MDSRYEPCWQFDDQVQTVVHPLCRPDCAADEPFHYRCTTCGGIYCLHPGVAFTISPEQVHEQTPEESAFIAFYAGSKRMKRLNDIVGNTDSPMTFSSRSTQPEGRCTVHGEMTTDLPSCPHCGDELAPDTLPEQLPLSPARWATVQGIPRERSWGTDWPALLSLSCPTECDPESSHYVCGRCGQLACIEQDCCAGCGRPH